MWRWQTGPEAGTTFWTGGADGSSITHANWASTEPNDFFVGEDFLSMIGDGQWFDSTSPTPFVCGYVLEFSVGEPGSVGLPSVGLIAAGVAVRRSRKLRRT